MKSFVHAILIIYMVKATRSRKQQLFGSSKMVYTDQHKIKGFFTLHNNQVENIKC